MKRTLNQNLIKIINLLNDGEYHDGTTLGHQLNMTRSAVWKIIKKLERYHVAIDSAKGKGYILQESLILLDAQKIKKQLHEPVHITVFESISSTNDYLREHPSKHAIEVCLAEHQTAGRGRMARKWHSPFGKNIYLSCRYSFAKDISELAGLSLIAGLAVAKTIKEFGVDDVKVKWPNDVFVQQKKIAGILIDLQGESHGKSQAIIGIGLNVNLQEDDGEIAQPWTSLRTVLGADVDRNLLCTHLINNLLAYFARFAETGLAAFLSEWQTVDYLLQCKVTFTHATKTITGTVVGINEIGQLLLQLPDETIASFASGDVTLVR